jgi:hypothetical protein
MRLRICLTLCLAAALSHACGDAAEPTPPATPTPSPPTASDVPSGSAGTRSGAGCDPEACPAVSVLGMPVAGCCQESGECGARIDVGGTALCSPPNIDQALGTLPNPFAQLQSELVTLDSACPSVTVFGTRLPGCCDRSGVCGASTAPFASGGSNAIAGLDIALTCVTASEAPMRDMGMPESVRIPCASLDAGIVPDADPGE